MMTLLNDILRLLEAILRRLPPPPIRNLKGKLHMSTETLKWTDPLPASEIASIDILDNGAKIGSVAGGVQTFTTDTLTDGDHDFTAIVNGTNGHASVPSNDVKVTVSTVTPPITDLSGTTNP
jgi:hypothetical protein